MIYDPSKLEPHGPIYMHGYYDNWTIFQDTELYYFDAHTYDENYDFAINNYFHHAATLQDCEHITILSESIQISEYDVQPK